MRERHRFERELADLSLPEYDQAQPSVYPGAGGVLGLPSVPFRVAEERAWYGEAGSNPKGVVKFLILTHEAMRGTLPAWRAN